MNDKRRALGRGLGALIPTDHASVGGPVDVFFRDQSDPRLSYAHPQPAGLLRRGLPDDADGVARSELTTQEAGSGSLRPVPGAQFAELSVEAIRPNPRQPRTAFDPDELAELVTSIQQVGILQPVVVRAIAQHPATDDGADADAAYELVMGERRWRAARAAGLDHVPAIVKQTKDDDLLRDALLENLHRSDLNPLEEAAAYQQLLEDFGCTQEQLAGRIGRSRPQITNTLRLLKLPALVQRRVAAGVLSAGHARALLTLEDAVAMERLAQRIVAEGLSVRNVEEIVAVGAEARSGARAARTTHVEHLDDVAARLSDRLDTRVRVALGHRKGRVTIEFAGTDDLSRILGIIGVADVGVADT
ncbi:MAG: ParB/RepB/Spo0J family partition protein [Dermatophilaceae bacterium]